MSAIDLFGGAGGWDEAAEDLGLGKPLGIEWDAAACATREARGLRTLQADVALLDPLDFAPCTVLIASAPCQAFSSGGKGAGRDAMPTYKEAIARMVGGAGMQMSLGAEDAPGVVDVEWLDAACGDPRAHLVLEPLRWALALRPDVVALEQVPPVLPLWEAMADALRGVGYSCWTGLLTSEMFGVPQTRLRAILIARREGVAAAPPPTHARYVAPRSESEADDQPEGRPSLSTHRAWPRPSAGARRRRRAQPSRRDRAATARRTRSTAARDAGSASTGRSRMAKGLTRRAAGPGCRCGRGRAPT